MGKMMRIEDSSPPPPMPADSVEAGEDEFGKDDDKISNSGLDILLEGALQMNGLGLTTGCLPDDQPILERGRAYCFHDFRRRVVDWFTEERGRQRKAEEEAAAEEAAEAAAEAAAEEQVNPRSRGQSPPSAPTRIQPLRAAKKRRLEESEHSRQRQQEQQEAKRRRTRLSSYYGQGGRSDYWLEDAEALARIMDADHVDTLWTGIAAVLDDKADQLRPACAWALAGTATGLEPGTGALADLGQDEHRPPPFYGWCPIVAKPWACTELSYCLHGLGREYGGGRDRDDERGPCSHSRAQAAPDAHMDKDDDDAAGQRRSRSRRRNMRKKAAIRRHINERKMDMFGLQFAVDVCNGSPRVLML